MVVSLTWNPFLKTQGNFKFIFRYFKFLIIPLLICFVLTANIFPELSEFADLKYDGIPFQAHVEMLVVFGLLVTSTYILDRLCRFAQYKQFIGWF